MGFTKVIGNPLHELPDVLDILDVPSLAPRVPLRAQSLRVIFLAVRDF